MRRAGRRIAQPDGLRRRITMLVPAGALAAAVTFSISEIVPSVCSAASAADIASPLQGRRSRCR